MLAIALISLGLAGSAFSWPTLGRSNSGQVARGFEAEDKPSGGLGRLSMAYYTSWHAGDVPLDKVSWSKVSTVMCK